MPKHRRRLAVQKTYKLFIDGKFVRGAAAESDGIRRPEAIVATSAKTIE